MIRSSNKISSKSLKKLYARGSLDCNLKQNMQVVLCMQELKERIESVKSRSSNSGAFTSVSENEFSDEIFQIRKAFVTIHGEMVLLKNYSSLNFAGMHISFIFFFLKPLFSRSIAVFSQELSKYLRSMTRELAACCAFHSPNRFFTNPSLLQSR